ncbi:glycosyltransferase family 2 protein [Actinomyces bowdenii]
MDTGDTGDTVDAVDAGDAVKAADGVGLTIAMLTYRRNTYLEEVLPLLVAQARSVAPRARARVLIVDNDPDAGGRRVVAAARAQAPGMIDYVHEPAPGIVAGRNRALSESADSDLLVFIDDDEIPGPGWLEALLRTWRARGCAAVTGPTPPSFEAEPDGWVRASGAFDSWSAADGAQVRSADTGNLLLDLSAVRAMGLRFDPRYGLTGGEDSLFTRQLTLGGGRIVFAAEAVVTKRVPAARARRAWVLQRAYRSGSSWARVRIDTAAGHRPGSRLGLRAAYAAKGAAKAGVDGARGLVARLRGDTAAQARHETSSRGGLGMVVGAWGLQVREYGRPRAGSAPPAAEQGRAEAVPPARSLTIAIPTFQRPEQLARALGGVLDQAGPIAGQGPLSIEVLVIDNDPQASGRPAAAAARAGAGEGRGVAVRYVVEDRPGVAAVRNRALDEASARDLLVFIDDDEEPEPGWLEALLGLHARRGCQAVAGPVIPAYEREPEPWVAQGGFFVRRTWPTGTRRPVAASNCLLLDLRFVRRMGLRFDEAFGATGGEDTLFTRALSACGGRILWCDEARVRDHVPASRLDRDWILRRQASHAATAVRVELALAQGDHRSRAAIRARAGLGGAARLGLGLARSAAGTLLGSPRHAARGARLAARGRGMIGAGLGRAGHREYGRPSSA